MKITEIKTYTVNPGGRNLVFVKVCTDEGIDGIGEAYSVGPDRATVETINYFADWLKGFNPMDVEALWARMYNGSRFPGGSVVNSAISGIEHALWDITGKALGVPVYRLLGGKYRDKIRVYQSAGGGTPEALAERALALVQEYGYTAIKIGPHPPGSYEMPYNEVLNGAAARMEAVRNAVGDGVDIGVDSHAKIFEPARAIMMAEAIASYRPLFLEEPLRPENIDALADVRSKVKIPIATGEMLYTKYEFRDLMVRQAVDIIQPDICCAGGIMECKKIAGMAEAFYVPLAPHNPMGPVATAVNAHLATAIPNFLILEYIPDDKPPRSELLVEPMKLENGYITVPDKPGLGVELNEEAFSKYPYRDWNRGFPHREDGSMAFI
jgi:galactonate dehydratase